MKFACLWWLAATLAWAHQTSAQKTRAELEADMAQTKAALQQLAEAEITTGASSPGFDASCEHRLADLQHRLVAIRADIKQLQETMTSTAEGVEISAAESAEFAGNTAAVREAQNYNAGLAQAAAAKAAADARTSMTTQILGFLSVLLTIGLRAYNDRQNHSATSQRIDGLARNLRKDGNSDS